MRNNTPHYLVPDVAPGAQPMQSRLTKKLLQKIRVIFARFRRSHWCRAFAVTNRFRYRCRLRVRAGLCSIVGKRTVRVSTRVRVRVRVRVSQRMTRVRWGVAASRVPCGSAVHATRFGVHGRTAAYMGVTAGIGSMCRCRLRCRCSCRCRCTCTCRCACRCRCRCTLRCLKRAPAARTESVRFRAGVTDQSHPRLFRGGCPIRPRGKSR